MPVGLLRMTSHDVCFVQVIPGEYVQAGRQGSPRMGLVQPPTDLPSNSELLASRSFRCDAITVNKPVDYTVGGAAPS